MSQEIVSSEEKIIDDSEPIDNFIPLTDLPDYSISKTTFRVKNNHTGKILKPSPDRYGYLKYCLYRNGKKTNKYIHKLIAIYFMDFDTKIHKGMTIDHIDRNLVNNSPENLRIVTPSENNKNRGTYTKRECDFILELPIGKQYRLISYKNMDIEDEYFRIDGEVYKKIKDGKYLHLAKTKFNRICIRIKGKIYNFTVNSKHLITELTEQK
jgi:hypothetical protein